MTDTTIADRIRAMHHLALPVTDVERAERFYTQVLGATVTRRRTDPELAKCAPHLATHISIQLGGAPRIDLFPQAPMPEARENSHPHYAFDVPVEEFLECARLLTEHGVGHSGPVRQGPPGTASIYFDDPDGNHLEIVCHGYPDDAPIQVGPPDREKMRYEWPPQ